MKTVHGDDEQVVEYLKTRLVGSNMCMYMHNRGKVLEAPHPVQYVDCSFYKEGIAVKRLVQQWKSTAKGIYKYRGSTAKEKCLTRPRTLRHLRLDQWFRYFKPVPKFRATALHQERERRLERRHLDSRSKRGFTFVDRYVHDVQDDETHVNFDIHATEYNEGDFDKFEADEENDLNVVCRRRANKEVWFLRS